MVAHERPAEHDLPGQAVSIFPEDMDPAESGQSGIGQFDVTATPLLLAACVLLWVAGFDVLYALQDVDFDRRTGLFSIPARFPMMYAAPACFPCWHSV